MFESVLYWGPEDRQPVFFCGNCCAECYGTRAVCLRCERK